MNNQAKFVYIGNVYKCNVYIDIAVDPCFIFINLLDKDLISFFGEDITIKTDFDNLLPQKGDYGELVKLKQAILDAIKTFPEFLTQGTDWPISKTHKRITLNSVYCNLQPHSNTGNF